MDLNKIKISVKGAYGEYNFGDDLLMVVFENYFINNFDKIELNFLGIDNDYAQNLLKNSTYQKQIEQTDWLVYGGGTQFFSFKRQPFLKRFFKVILKPKKIVKKIKDSFESKVKNTESNNIDFKKVAFLGFGLGPFKSDSVKLIAKSKLKRANFVRVRDSISFQYCKEWNIDTTLGADVVFSSYFKIPELQEKKTNKQKKKIGIIVRDWRHDKEGNAYIQQIKKFYKEDESNDYRFVIFSSLKDKSWMDFTKKENPLIWNPKTNSIDDFLSELNQFDSFVTARYHGAILGVLLGKPVICIEVESKLRVFTEDFKGVDLWEKPFDRKKLTKLVKDIDYTINYPDLENHRERASKMLHDFSLSFKINK